MKKLIIKLVDLVQVEESNEVDGATVTTTKWVEDKEIVSGSRELHDWNFQCLPQVSYDYIKNLACRMIEIEIMKLKLLEDETEVMIQNSGTDESEIRDIVSDVLDECSIDLEDFNASISVSRY